MPNLYCTTHTFHILSYTSSSSTYYYIVLHLTTQKEKWKGNKISYFENWITSIEKKKIKLLEDNFFTYRQELLDGGQPYFLPQSLFVYPTPTHFDSDWGLHPWCPQTCVMYYAVNLGKSG